MTSALIVLAGIVGGVAGWLAGYGLACAMDAHERAARAKKARK